MLRLRRARERRRTGLFLAEGVREVERAYAAGLDVRTVYVARELLPQWTPPPDAGGAAAATADTRVHEVSVRVLARMAYRREPEGVIAVVEEPRRPLPPPHDLSLVLVAVGIEKPGNLGAMARTADAAGADALVVAEAASDPWNPNAVRASAGAVFALPIVEATLDEVAALPLTKVAAVIGAPTAYTDADLTQPAALIIGAEDAGLDDRWRAAADLHVSIPMDGTVTDSLNAGIAAALLLFEARRQRGA